MPASLVLLQNEKADRIQLAHNTYTMLQVDGDTELNAISLSFGLKKQGLKVLKVNSFKLPPDLQGKIVPLSYEQKFKNRKNYGWIAGEDQNLFAANPGGRRGAGPISYKDDRVPFSPKDFKPMEWAQARALLNEEFKIDPTKPITANDLKSIYDQSLKIYQETSNDEGNPEKIKTNHRYEHIQDFFDVQGRDYEKMAELLNSVAKNKSQINGFLQFSSEGGEIEEDKEMVEGIADILSQVKNPQNRSQIAQNMIGDFKRENVKYDLNKFLSMAKVMKKGGQMIKRADGSYSRRGLWDNIRANSGSEKKPTPEMLEQERKIRRENKEIGGIFMGQKLFRPRKSSIFANGGMTSRQFYNFLFDDDYDYEENNLVKSNNAPSQSELDKMNSKNNLLIEENQKLNKLLLRNRMNAAAMEIVNSPYADFSSSSQGYSSSPYITNNPDESYDNTYTNPIIPGIRGTSWQKSPLYTSPFSQGRGRTVADLPVFTTK